MTMGFKRSLIRILVSGGTCFALAASQSIADNTPCIADNPKSLGDSVNLGPRAAPKPGDRGGQLFSDRCAICHENVTTRAPSPAMLSLMAPESIVRTLTDGAMQAQGKAVADPDKVLIAEYLTGRKVSEGSDGLTPPMCSSADAAFDFDRPPELAGWGIDPENTHAVAGPVGGISKENLQKLHLKWAVGLRGAIRVRSQPTFGGGAMYVGAQDGRVTALNLRSGCARWTFQAPTEIRTGLVVSPWKRGDGSARPLLYFGTKATVYALDARTGKEVWEQAPDKHPITILTAAPVLSRGVLYVGVASLEEISTSAKYECCTFRGSLIAYDAQSGREIWRYYTIDDPAKVQGTTSSGTKILAPSGAGVWNPLAIDEKRSQLTFATGNNYSRPATVTSDAVIALDLKTGKRKWVYQATHEDAWDTGCVWGHSDMCPNPEGPDFDFAAATILATASGGRDYIVAADKSGHVYALDPDDGRLVWKVPVGRGGSSGGIEFGLAVRGNAVYVGVNDFDDGKTKYTEAARPGLYALDLSTGKYLWKAPDSGETCRGKPRCLSGIYAGISTVPELVLAGNDDGWLRIYDAQDGHVLWRYDMTASVTTVGGGRSSGGAMGGPTYPVAYHGMLVVPSGWGMLQYMPGNAVFVFDTK
jgi:polyvinyl alcohol dehydrogenase (cytochrome)